MSGVKGGSKCHSSQESVLSLAAGTRQLVLLARQLTINSCGAHVELAV